MFARYCVCRFSIPARLPLSDDSVRPIFRRVVAKPPTSHCRSCTAACGIDISDTIVRGDHVMFRSSEPTFVVFVDPSHHYDGHWHRNTALSALLGTRKELFVGRKYAGTYDVTKVYRDSSVVSDYRFANGRSLHREMLGVSRLHATDPKSVVVLSKCLRCRSHSVPNRPTIFSSPR